LKIIAIVGSPRPNGNTNYLTDLALEEASKLGAETEKAFLGKYTINPCLGHQECKTYDTCVQKDDAIPILDKVYKADGVILATPVYYFNVSAQLKALIDRNFYHNEHKMKCKAKAVGIIVVAGGDGIKDTVTTLKRYVDDAFTVNEENVFVASGYADIHGEVKDKPDLIEAARNVGRQMAESLK